MAKINMETKLILPDTSLCAIVRDEMINPAQLPGKSGIRSFVESHVPYVEQAVIVDTGSIDGTRQELEQLVSEFPNLKVSDRPFDNYASARNDSLTKVETKYALVLDVDELLPKKSISLLASEKVDTKFAIKLGVHEITSSGLEENKNNVSQLLRLINMDSKPYFCNAGENTWEFLQFDPRYTDLIGIRNDKNNLLDLSKEISFYHFMPAELSIYLKRQQWYDQPERFSESPSLRENFKLWKQPNPHRIKYK